MTCIEKIISEYASLRGISVETVLQEIRNGDDTAVNEMFKMACAFDACK